MLTWAKCQVAVVFSVFVVLRAMDRVFNKRINDRMQNYNLMYTNVIWPVGVQLMTYLLVAAYVVYNRRQTGDRRYGLGFFGPRADIATAYGAYPQWRLALFSFWDQLNAIITALPSPFIDQTSQSIMSNFVVMWSVGISIVYLGARYAQEHYLACALILISALVSVVVQLQTGDPPLGEYTNALKQTVTSSPLWYLIYVVGTVPAAISNCYKQKCLKGVDLEVMYATLWAGNWQILWGVVLFPMNWLPLPTPAPQNYPAETGTYLSNTLTCFFGSAPTHWNGTAHVVSSGDAVCASPGGSAALWFVFYLLFNVSFNVLLLWLTKRMSATWATIATVLCLDLTSLFSMSPALMGDEAKPVTLEQYLGLVIAAIAMLVYNLKPELDKYGQPVAGVEHGFESRAPTLNSFSSDRSALVGRATFSASAQRQRVHSQSAAFGSSSTRVLPTVVGGGLGGDKGAPQRNTFS